MVVAGMSWTMKSAIRAFAGGRRNDLMDQPEHSPIQPVNRTATGISVARLWPSRLSLATLCFFFRSSLCLDHPGHYSRGSVALDYFDQWGQLLSRVWRTTLIPTTRVESMPEVSLRQAIFGGPGDNQPFTLSRTEPNNFSEILDEV